MPDLSLLLRSALLAAPGVQALAGGRIHQELVPEDSARPYVWLSRREAADDELLAGALGAEPDSESFDVECVAEGLSDAVDLARAVRAAVHNARGDLGGGRVQLVQVRTQSEEYVPRAAAEAGDFVAALDVVMWR